LSIPVFASIAAVRAALKNRPDIGLVPTMGALHAGHARLIEAAHAQCGTVVVSIFVNPIQFDRKEDYERYGRSLPADVALCERSGAAMIFAPSVDEMYPEPNQTIVEVTGVTDHFCGLARPGHFRGVTTVVAKLFHIVGPRLAFFGEKDAQQLAAVTSMVAGLDFPLRIVPVETVREPDGLAMSSRNSRLNPDERQRAACLYRALVLARDLIASGERDSSVIIARGLQELAVPGVRVEYFGLADPRAMTPVFYVEAPVRVMGAIWIGETRLIDNLLCTP
jgi:pantoate--beta-alanine ligase